MRIFIILFLTIFLNIFIFPNANTIEGELTKTNVKIGNGELATITVKYKLWTLMGEPVKITEYKYSASRSLVSGVKIYLKTENLTKTAWAYVQDCGGAIPKPGDNWSFNSPGSPKWSELFGGTGVYEKKYFTEKQAKNFWKNGFTITDFIIEANLEESLPSKSDSKYLKNTYDNYNEYFDKYKLSSSEIRRNEMEQEEEIYEKLQKEIEDFYAKQKRIQENRQFWADLMNIITTGINNIGKIIDENNKVLNKLNDEYKRDLKKIDEDIEREKRKAAEDEKRRQEEQKKVTKNFDNYETTKGYDNDSGNSKYNKNEPNTFKFFGHNIIAYDSEHRKSSLSIYFVSNVFAYSDLTENSKRDTKRALFMSKVKEYLNRNIIGKYINYLEGDKYSSDFSSQLKTPTWELGPGGSSYEMGGFEKAKKQREGFKSETIAREFTDKYVFIDIDIGN